MQSTDHEVLRQAIDWLEQGQAVTLFTVATTWGSSPRPPGSLLAISADGRLSGSVSGGCVEEDLVQRLQDGSLCISSPSLIDYGVNREDAARFGLPCGGRLELVVEQLETANPLRPVLQAIESRRVITRRVCLTTGESSLHSAAATDSFYYDGETLSKPFGPSWRLLLIGAGQLSRYVAQFAQALDYEVIVCDPREEYGRSWQVAGSQLDTRMPDDAVTALATDHRCVVMALSHDPKLDDMALMNALNADLFYVGALGSQRNNDKRRERLATLGVAPANLARLHGPIGLPIGSKTPPEIAIAILADVTAARHGIQLQRDTTQAAVTPSRHLHA